MISFAEREKQVLASLEDRMGDGSRYPRLTGFYWTQVKKITSNRDIAIKYASEKISSKRPTERFLAASVFSRLLNPVAEGDDKLALNVVRLLTSVAESEPVIAVKVEIAFALGMPYLPEAQPTLLMLSQDKNPEVRLAATQSLGSTTSDAESGALIDRLIELSADPEAEVRNWATMTLGRLETSTREIRDAIFARINDRHGETRAEAFRALALHNDVRGKEPLLELLKRKDQKDQAIWRWEIEAAGLYGDPIFYEVLSDIATWWKDERSELAWAKDRCSPVAALRAKTSRDEFMYGRKFDAWQLMPDGVTVQHKNGDLVANLQNECSLTELHPSGDELIAVFLKDKETDSDGFLFIGDRIVIAISPIEHLDIPKMHYPARLDRIYMRESGLIAVVVDSKEYKFKGKDLKIEFYPG